MWLIKHHATQAPGGLKALFHAFLTSELDGNEWSASRSGRFTLGERVSICHSIGGCMSLRIGMDALKERKSFSV
jgi:hypothetical protein